MPIKISGLPRHRSRSLRRVAKKTPGGKTVVHYVRRKPSKAHCGVCGSELQGTARGTTTQISKLSKSQKRPERPFGGQLCTSCSRRVIAIRAKLNAKEIKAAEVPISLKNYVI